MTGTGQTGVELDRVVAVTATWADGHAEVGSGYLVTGRLVLTAGHCIRDKESGKIAARIKVVRASDGASASGGAVTVCPELDVAVIALGDDAPWEAELPGVVFARVDRSRTGMLEDCQAIGFPARTPPEDAGRVAALGPVRLSDRTRTYRPFSYLVAADDGQTGGWSAATADSEASPTK